MNHLLPQKPPRHRRKVIGVMGPSNAFRVEFCGAREIGAAIAARNLVLLTGGLGGIMEAASQGAHEAGGLTVGLSPGGSALGMNDFVHITIPTSMGGARNFMNIMASDAVIAFGSMGSAGTLTEIGFALQSATPLLVYKPPAPLETFLDAFRAPGQAIIGTSLQDVESFLDAL